MLMSQSNRTQRRQNNISESVRLLCHEQMRYKHKTTGDIFVCAAQHKTRTSPAIFYALFAVKFIFYFTKI